MPHARLIATSAAFASSLLIAQSVWAGAHTWRVNEAFSSPDGSVQFIELKECCGGDGEVNVNGFQVTSNTNAFTFPSNLLGDTTFKHLLLATQAFADLPGAPAPDYIIPANFFNPAGDTLSYHVYDAWTIGAVPGNCIDSLNRDAPAGPNSPTNFNDATGQVNGCPGPGCVADFIPPGGDGNVNVNDLLGVINAWGSCPVPPATCPADIAPDGGDQQVNVNDLLAVINNWGTCK